ncbi:MAG: hypothetical protein AB7F89_14315 [Pirellulaceae bacterium]
MSGARSGRRWLFRLLAVGVGLSPFLLVEAALRIAGWQPPPGPAPRYVELAGTRPLFERNAAGDRWEIPATRQPFFKPDSFSATKGATEFRVFCFGGSTVQGNPYSIETSFTTWLELSLRAAEPSCEWQVVNCGGISYASYRLAPIVRECLAYEPDLFILCMGHNEFLEDRSYGHLKQIPPWVAGLAALFDRSRLVQAARYAGRQAESREAASPTRLAAEVDALLDYRGGLEWYHRDDVWRRQVVDHFRASLTDMITASRAAGVPVLLVDPVENLRDCPPFKSQADDQLTAVQQQQFRGLLQPDASGGEDRTRDLEAAVAIDRRHANAWYLLGRAYLAEGNDSAARHALMTAKDEDVCPLRAIEAIHAVIAEVGQSTNTPVIDVRSEFARRSPHGIPGDELLLDHVHPSITGHQLIADLLLDYLLAQQFVEADPGWRSRQQQRYQEHLSTLEAPYFARGREHLDGLRKWTSGRVQKLRSPATLPLKSP